MNRSVALRLPPKEEEEYGEFLDAVDTNAEGAFSARVPPGRHLLSWDEDPPVPLGEVVIEDSSTRDVALVLRRR